MAQFVSQDSVLAASVRLVSAAKQSLDSTSGWIKGSALRLLLESVRPKLAAGELKVRIVYRLKEMSDLDITELAALKEFEEIGAEVRFCRRLHAKMVLVDGAQAVISSSNLTATAGYTFRADEQQWTNYEAGIVAEHADAELVRDAQRHFERIWKDSAALSEDVVGAVIGQPHTTGFQFVLLRGVRRTQFVLAECDDGYLLAAVDDVSTINVSFPELDQPAEKQNSVGFNRRPLPDLSTLFTGELKEQAFLLTTTFYDSAAAFAIATARVLKQQLGGRPRMPLTPTAPGAIVRPRSCGARRRRLPESQPAGLHGVRGPSPLSFAARRLVKQARSPVHLWPIQSITPVPTDAGSRS